MAQQPHYELKDVNPVTFIRHMITDDGEKIVFEILDKAGATGHIAVDWLSLSLVVQLITRAAEEGAEIRKALGKPGDYHGSSDLTYQLVDTFQVSEVDDRKLGKAKILSLYSPTGFRCDFAIPFEMFDRLGRPFPRAIAEELLADESEIRRRPN